MSLWSLDGVGTLDSASLSLDGAGSGAGPTVLTPTSLYDFEDPSLFFKDFATSALFGNYEAQVILSLPGQDIMGGKIASNQYEMEYVTNTLPGLGYGSAVTIRTIAFSVLQTYPLDDGVCSRARLQT